MKIAVPYENGNIFQHFGKTTQFKFYTINGDRPMKIEIADTEGQGHGALAEFLKNHKVTTVICGGIGGGAKEALKTYHIEVVNGIQGDIDSAVVAYLAGTLDFDPSLHCDHHDQHNGCHHSCSGHGHEHSLD